MVATKNQSAEMENAISRDRLIVRHHHRHAPAHAVYFDYGLLLLAVPAVLLAGEVMSRRPIGPRRAVREAPDRRLVRAIRLADAQSPIAGMSCVNVSVVLLSTISGLSIVRAFHDPYLATLTFTQLIPAMGGLSISQPNSANQTPIRSFSNRSRGGRWAPGHDFPRQQHRRDRQQQQSCQSKTA